MVLGQKTDAISLGVSGRIVGGRVSSVMALSYKTGSRERLAIGGQGMDVKRAVRS